MRINCRSMAASPSNTRRTDRPRSGPTSREMRTPTPGFTKRGPYSMRSGQLRPNLGKLREESQTWFIECPDHQAPIEEAVELLAACLREKRTAMTRGKVAGIRTLTLLT